ncbi:hypothetical protein B0A49_13814, partial [Cryomyces minteri]
MPSNSNTHGSSTSNSNSKNTAQTSASSGKSQRQMVNEAGHANFPNFLASYGLRIYNPDDVQEGKEILNTMSNLDYG